MRKNIYFREAVARGFLDLNVRETERPKKEEYRKHLVKIQSAL